MAESGSGTALAIGALRPGAIVLAQGLLAERALGALAIALALEGKPEAGTAWVGAQVRALPLGAGQWLLLSETLQGADLAAALTPALTGTDVTWVDLGHARAGFCIEGAHALEVLAKGCPLDLELAPVGFAAASVLGPFAVVLHRRAGARWEVYVASSFGQALGAWLREAGREYASAR